jgi:MFS superfamily sulfate permease-like transporter
MESFANLLRFDLLVAAFTLAFVASAETLLSATAVDQMHNGPRTEYNRELRSQGIGNILVGLIGGIPMTGVIVRSATNVAAGARTRAATMFHGAWLLVLVAAVPWILEMVPTASLAAVLVYTGYKLVNPQNVRRLLKYGGAPVLIYAATVIMIVATDLLTGILVGLGFSLAKIIYALSHMDIRVSRQGGRLDIHVAGAATFIRMPKLVDTLESIPRDAEVHLHFEDLDYVDHACLDAISNWERQRTERDSKVVVAWEQLETKRQLGSQRRQPRAAVAELAAR